MKADAALFESYAVAHRLGIGVTAPLSCIDDMDADEFDSWCAYFILTGEPLRVKS
jgi:hypothetical protein